MWHTIAYVSTVNPELTDSDIKELLEFSKQYNNKHCITGILMYSDGNFFQILEGESKKVKSLFERIRNDTRHYDVIKIFDRNIESPSFSTYHCSFMTVYQDHYSRIELNLFLMNEQLHNPKHYKEISYLTKKFMKLS